MPQRKGWLLGGLGECAPARQGNPAMAAKYMSEHMPRYVRGKAAYKERWAWQVLADVYWPRVPSKLGLNLPPAINSGILYNVNPGLINHGLLIRGVLLQ